MSQPELRAAPVPAAVGADRWFEIHRERLEQARVACRTRRAWSAFADQAALYPDHVRARADGERAFAAWLGQRYPIDQGPPLDWVGEEVSPYTQRPLDVRYPRCDLDALFASARSGIDAWTSLPARTRAGVLLEILDRLYSKRLFELVYAVMHTAGQSFAMAYAGSGVNALDRGLEALVYALDALEAVTPTSSWERSFGSTAIRLEKRYRTLPRGVAVCFTCASFPTWNAFPALMASLATGNAVIVKPHPATVLPMAIAVDVFREVLSECGLDPNLVTMALDTVAEPIGKRIVGHPDCAIVDFTGGARFGRWVERNAAPALCFTETAGCNAVILDSCEDLEPVIRALATTLCLFSAQMCTSPQNIYIPAGGMRVGSGASAKQVSFDTVAQRLAAAVDRIASEPQKAAAILATIQSPTTLALVAALESEGRERGAILLASRRYAHPDFPDARTCTPLMLGVTPAEHDLYAEERFGPISFVIRTRDRTDAIIQASTDIQTAGGLTAFLYSTDEAYIADAERRLARAGAQLTINLTGPMPLNFAAAYSDYHVTGLNPAGNATLTDASFIAGRFRIVQTRRPAPV